MPININPFSTDVSYMNRIAEEASIVRGIPCQLITQSRVDDIYKEGSVAQTTSVDLYALISDNPSKKLLRQLDWLPEDGEVLPYVVKIPRTLNEIPLSVVKGQLVKFHDMTLVIGEVRTSYSYGSWYLTKCVPYDENREGEDQPISVKHQNSFIKEEY